MDQLKKDITDLLKKLPKKEELTVKHRNAYHALIQKFSEVASKEDTLLVDLKPVQTELNKVSEIFRDL